ncbi:hypothetical protein [Halorientalis halophila]|uniref:hypothetical protein n=1 Tax=Halorientalis halophila TaxID=3108499 RepID=UPI003009ECD4
MGTIRDGGTDGHCVIDRAARLTLALVVLGALCTGTALGADATTVSPETPSPVTPAQAADDPGAATGQADAGDDPAIPVGTGPAAGAGVAAGLAVAVGLVARFDHEG